jgi:hypothetical protein
MTEDRGQMAEDRWQKADGRGWEIGEFGRRKSEWGSDWKVKIGRIYKGK